MFPTADTNDRDDGFQDEEEDFGRPEWPFEEVLGGEG